MIKIEFFYVLAGLALMLVGVLAWRDSSNPKRHTSALFWGVYGALMVCSTWLPPAYSGALVLLLALLGGLGGVGKGQEHAPDVSERLAHVARLGNWLFAPSLLIPLLTVVGAVLLKDMHFGGKPLLDQGNLTMVSLGIGCLIALAWAHRLTGARPAQSVHETKRLLEAMGYAVILPQLLAMLGMLFNDVGVGKAVAHLATQYLPMDQRWAAVGTYAVSMTLFTMIMGNAFAAFPVMTAGIGIPVLVGQYHGDPAVMAAIGMFSGYCGTLMTPMAANFNIVPATLLDLEDRNAVIKRQIPTALGILLINIVLMNLLMFRK
ncbi:DUF979 domain-containing protein [Burkholderiaceae bacterium DAT-1]|nr:DUF979 domain-containing protein [Burkholderiaceae bacterium DAT-1]